MKELIQRVERDLDNNWPVEANDIRLLLVTVRTLADTLGLLDDLAPKK